MTGRAGRRGLPSVVRIACDGAGLLGAVRAAVANLESHVDEINALNVFPVPDGDTGSNMFATCTEMLRYVRTRRAWRESPIDSAKAPSSGPGATRA
jgi:dihydroxyacetone kinase-like predicted kinase